MKRKLQDIIKVLSTISALIVAFVGVLQVIEGALPSKSEDGE